MRLATTALRAGWWNRLWAQMMGWSWVAASLVSLSTALLVGGCSTSSADVANQARAGDGKGFVAGNGTIQQLARTDRTTSIQLSGTTLDGSEWSQTKDAVGRVLVINVWGSWCPPCVAETPILQNVWSSYEKAGKQIAFIGLNIKESPATALAFTRANQVTFPSLSNDANGGRPVLALQGKAPATPSTLVVDKQGRLAARVLGPVTAATLTAIVDEVLAESD